MKKWKIPLLILITVVLLVVGAFLPDIASAGQDHVHVAQVGFSEIESLKLDFSNSQSMGALLKKLTLVRDGSFYSVSSSKTKLPREKMEQTVKEALALYYQEELIPYNWTGYSFSAVPHLVYNGNDSGIYGIFWVITIHWTDIDDDLTLFLDDETGLILYIHYGSAIPLENYTPQDYLDTLSNTYFTSTGISEIVADPSAYGVESIFFDDTGLYTNGDQHYSYSFQHPEYGVLEIQFWLYKHGFYTIIR